MSKYSNVSTTDLSEFVNTSLSEIDNHNFEEIKRDLSSGIFNVPVKQKIIDLFNQIMTSKEISGSIVNLKSDLNKLKSAVDIINQIHAYEADLNKFQEVIGNVNNRLAYDKNLTEYDRAQLNRQYQDCQTQINNINSTIGALEGQVDYLLS